MADTYRTFTRTWWKANPSWHNGLEPCPGRRHTHETGLTYEQALDYCRRWNNTHKPGRLSRKCEFEKE